MGQKESAWAWVMLGLDHLDSEPNWATQSIWVGTVITKKNCLRIFTANLRVISAMTGNPLLDGHLHKDFVPPDC